MVVVTAFSGFQLFCPALIECEYLDSFIYRIAEDLFHIVEMRLGHIDGVNTIHFRNSIDIMVASAAEVDTTAAEAIKQTAVIRNGKFTIKIRGKEVACFFEQGVGN